MNTFFCQTDELLRWQSYCRRENESPQVIGLAIGIGQIFAMAHVQIKPVRLVAVRVHADICRRRVSVAAGAIAATDRDASRTMKLQKSGERRTKCRQFLRNGMLFSFQK